MVLGEASRFVRSRSSPFEPPFGVDIYEATTADDVDALVPLFPRVHERVYLPSSVEQLRDLLRVQVGRKNVILLLVGRPPTGFCWMEVVAGGALFIHLIYLEGDDQGQQVWPVVYKIAQSRGCTQIFAHVFRTATARLFKAYGFRPQGILISCEVMS